MTLLDRFRAQPPDKHPDPAVRLAHVAELPLEARDAIAAMARDDADPRVRKAAVAKLLAPEILGIISGSDSDESVRATALEMLRDLAIEAFEGTGEAESVAAVDALADPRFLSQVAKSAPRGSIALRALSRVADGRMLGSVARHAVTDAARLGALDALAERHEASEILAVALNSEFKDTAVRAVDLVTERESLEQIATRSRNKNAVKRARGIIRDQDDRAAREAAADAARAAEARVSESHQELPAPMSTDALLDPSTPAVPADAVTPEQGQAALPAVPDAGPASPLEAVAAAADVDPAEAQRTAEAAAAREEERTSRLTSLADEAAQAADAEDVAAVHKRFGALRREWAEFSGAGPTDASVAARFADADARFAAREAAAQEADAKARREALARMHNLLGRVEQLVAERTCRSRRPIARCAMSASALSSIPPLPTKADYDDVTTRLKAAQEALAPKVTELREADDWQQWANVTVQEQLCARMEALSALSDPDAIAKEVRELQQQWRAAADVPRDKADGCGAASRRRTTRSGRDAKRTSPTEARERAENLTKKIALCEQAEALAESTNWIQTAEAIKALQAEWKTIGPVSRGREKAIWDRFRTACDRFFTRRHEDLAQRKAMWAENLAKKDALCARAEALAESTDWDAAAAEIKQLQAEWKTIGPVKKSRSEAIWQRFRDACDRFFDPLRASPRHRARRARRGARSDLRGARSARGGRSQAPTRPADLLATVRGIRGRWQQEIAARGVDPDRARALDTRFADAFAKVIARWPAAFGGTDLDPDANRKRMEALVKKVEELATSLAGPGGRAGCRPLADEPPGRDAEGSARRQHHRRQGRRRQPLARRGRGGAAGAGRLVAPRSGAGRRPPAARPIASSVRHGRSRSAPKSATQGPAPAGGGPQGRPAVVRGRGGKWREPRHAGPTGREHAGAET